MSSKSEKEIKTSTGRRAGRREFFKKAATGIGALMLPVKAVEAAVDGDRLRILAALGETIIPSKPGDEGYKELEPYGITLGVNKVLVSLTDQMFVHFNQASRGFFEGRTFVELSEEERAEFLKTVIDGSKFADKASGRTAKRVYRLVRIAVFNVFYSNFPQHKVARDAEGIPILREGEEHQITNPNTNDVVTGWDIAGYRGPLTWEQENDLRAYVQKNHWHRDLEDLIVRYRPKKD